MIRPQFEHALKTITAARATARRPAAKIATLIAVLFFACCIARSDAQVESSKHASFDTSHIVGNWYGGANARSAQAVIADARANGVVASAQSMLTTTKDDALNPTATRANSVHVETVIHARRIVERAPFAVRFSSYLMPGQRRVIDPGMPGITWVTERITYWNDVPVGRQTLSRQVVRSAKPGVALIGTPRTLAELRAALPGHRVATEMTMVATAYTADSATAYPTGRTATGMLAREGVVAVDPRVIPLGTTLFVPGYGVAIAADTGGAIIGNRIDLCMDRYGDAMNFGRQTVRVYILKQ